MNDLSRGSRGNHSLRHFAGEGGDFFPLAETRPAASFFRLASLMAERPRTLLLLTANLTGERCPNPR